MDIDTVLQSADILHDDKARRVLNTAPDTYADITINELEHGITIERLTSLKVPVYQYGTQITIHGLFNEVPSDLRVNGYKSIVFNGNKSLGVKYAAIDSDKKTLLRDVSRYGNKTWQIHIDSQGCECWRIFASNNHADDKARLIECYNSTPDSLYIGSKQAASLMFGGYVVIIRLGAVYQSNLWQLITALTGIQNESEYQQYIAKQAELDKIENERYEQERKLRQESRIATLNKALANFTAPDNWQPFNGIPSNGNTYARITLDYSDNPILRVSQYAKRGAFTCVASKDFTDMVYKPWQPHHYSKAINKTINGWLVSDNVKPTPKPITTPSNDVTIRHNEKLNGIEVSFPVKPSDSILQPLKSMGFRWSQYAGLWYTHYTPDMFNKVNDLFTPAACH